MSHPIDENAVRPERGKAGPLKTVLVSLMIVLVGIALIWLIFKTEPTATRKDTARETAMLVDVQSVSRGRFTPTVEVMGQVVPSRQITLGSRVSGEVVHQADAFTPGRRVEEGAELLRIDPADFEATLQQRRSELQQAKADLELEQGQQAVARQEFELLGEDIEAVNDALILREPQLKQAKARVAAAEAAVKQAELDLARTRIRAPFPAQVLSREVTLGSQISTGQSLGRLAGTGQYWIEATVPLSKLHWLAFSVAPDAPGAPVILHHDTVWPGGQTREGRLTQLVGELDDNARMARVLITVEDPLALDQAEGKPAMILGSFVRAEIEGRPLDDVVRIERDLVRRNNTVWIMEERKLAIRDVEIAFRDDDYAYIKAGLENGDRVITNDLSSVVSGARLRLEGDGNE
ncbi:efflux RND transporter periplasmic adaptor subunit [Marinobacter orientalis]|uniref:Efflux RND transporter periplasmic adaptor subunit n=1 Tax=Marinobacter orientalis TaxID=1928859 RepID=A0A7Y0WTR7_9GAMM|nr:efflux RND transporter periplasmic adaptor subunit [Marinobacter orientalis]NMT65111.1 efflux RND transporter periplasmic adaptor subunit [Marinobacter orientalis]TGX48942.1 efflux RND transporter periplasmic adaptor subunit [Marinobacter orientalis]